MLLPSIAFSDRLSSASAFDIVVFGATPAGVAAAVSAARQNKKVLLISENDRLGGMFGWGICQQDVDTDVSPASVVGFAREVLARVAKQETVALKTFQRFHRLSATGRPSWFIRALYEIVAKEVNVSTTFSCKLDSCVVSNKRIEAIKISDGSGSYVVTASQFIDASYCGDLLAKAGCSFVIGREANALYGETLNGIRTAAVFPAGTVDPYNIPGSASSGLIAGVDSSSQGTAGDGDARVMAFTYRLLVTTSASDRIAFPLPDFSKYDPRNYEMLARAMASAPTSYDTFAEVFNMYTLNTASYWDMNSRSGMSSNFVSDQCKEYITANYTRRAEIAENVKQHILGMLFWIRYSGDGRIPANLVSEIATWGLSNDELKAYGGFSPELYVREGRRLIGDFVMNENDMNISNGFTDPVAYGYYDIDSHTVRRIVVSSTVRIEGSILTPLTTSQLGFGIPLRVLYPKASEITNLSSPTCPSVSRVVWCSVRMEPILMAMGQAAGIAASLAVDRADTIQNTPYVRLARIQDIQRVWDGIVLGNDGVSFTQGTLTETGTWTDNTSRFGFIGNKQRLAAAGANTAKFAPNIQEHGSYEVFVKYAPADSSRATNCKISVFSAQGATDATTSVGSAQQVLFLNQLYPGGRGGDWESLGIYTFRLGTPSPDYVLFDATGADSNVVISAVKFVKTGE